MDTVRLEHRFSKGHVQCSGFVLRVNFMARNTSDYRARHFLVAVAKPTMAIKLSTDKSEPLHDSQRSQLPLPHVSRLAHLHDTQIQRGCGVITHPQVSMNNKSSIGSSIAMTSHDRAITPTAMPTSFRAALPFT